MMKAIQPLFFFTLLTCCSCNKSNDSDIEVSQGRIIALVTGDDVCQYDKSEYLIAFAEEDVEWFNPKTRELKFVEKCKRVENIRAYAVIDVTLDNEKLFTICSSISSIVSRAYDDLVLFKDVETGKFYLYDNWPSYWNKEETLHNVERRAAGWDKFIEHLKSKHLIK